MTESNVPVAIRRETTSLSNASLADAGVKTADNSSNNGSNVLFIIMLLVMTSKE